MRGGSRSKRALQGDRQSGGDLRSAAPRVSLKDSVKVVFPVRGGKTKTVERQKSGLLFMKVDEQIKKRSR